MNVNNQYPELEKYILSKVGVTKDFKAEWGWHRFMIGNKMFTAFCGDDGENPLITIKCYPATNLILRGQFPSQIIPGYYMNKDHWSSVVVGAGVPFDVIKAMVDEGYALVFKSLTKKAQADILGG